jgi:hypothetical protein
LSAVPFATPHNLQAMAECLEDHRIFSLMIRFVKMKNMDMVLMVWNVIGGSCSKCYNPDVSISNESDAYVLMKTFFLFFTNPRCTH